METFSASLQAQHHCLVKKHWVGHEKVPVPACHQPALWPWRSHMVSLGLLQMGQGRMLHWTPKVPPTSTNILQSMKWKELVAYSTNRPGKMFLAGFLLMNLLAMLFFCWWTCKYNSLSPASWGQKQTVIISPIWTTCKKSQTALKL